jgi:hypothetical protein
MSCARPGRPASSEPSPEALIARHPEIRYVIAGRTHPHVAHREGERYRLMLERRAVRPLMRRARELAGEDAVVA